MEFLPWALTYGVPYDLFPHLNPTKLEPFKKSYEDRMKLEEEISNARQWKMGVYMRSALASVWNSENKYFEKPIDWSESDEYDDDNMTEEEIIKAREDFANKLNMSFGAFQKNKEMKEKMKG